MRILQNFPEQLFYGAIGCFYAFYDTFFPIHFWIFASVFQIKVFKKGTNKMKYGTYFVESQNPFHFILCSNYIQLHSVLETFFNYD